MQPPWVEEVHTFLKNLFCLDQWIHQAVQFLYHWIDLGCVGSMGQIIVSILYLLCDSCWLERLPKLYFVFYIYQFIRTFTYISELIVSFYTFKVDNIFSNKFSLYCTYFLKKFVLHWNELVIHELSRAKVSVSPDSFLAYVVQHSDSHTRTFNVLIPVCLHCVMMQTQLISINTIQHFVDQAEHSKLVVSLFAFWRTHLLLSNTLFMRMLWGL